MMLLVLIVQAIMTVDYLCLYCLFICKLFKHNKVFFMTVCLFYNNSIFCLLLAVLLISIVVFRLWLFLRLVVVGVRMPSCCGCCSWLKERGWQIGQSGRRKGKGRLPVAGEFGRNAIVIFSYFLGFASVVPAITFGGYPMIKLRGDRRYDVQRNSQ